MSTTPYGERIRTVLQTAVRTSGIKQGAIELKVWHLEVILEQIGFDPQTFFRLVYPRPGEEEGSTMEQFAAYASRHPRRHSASLSLPPDLRAAINEMVRDAITALREDDEDDEPEPPAPAKNGGPRKRPAGGGGRRKAPPKKK